MGIKERVKENKGTLKKWKRRNVSGKLETSIPPGIGKIPKIKEKKNNAIF